MGQDHPEGKDATRRVEFAKPPAAPAPSTPSANMAYPSTQTVEVDRMPVEFEMYALKDANGNPTNYIKVRDLGRKLGFNVSWSAEKGVFIETDKPYSEA